MALDRCLVLFTKPAIAGRVKTRLIGELTAEQAARLHGAFIADLVGRLRRGRFDLRIAWAQPSPAELPASPVPALRQEGADLGERLYRGLAVVAAGHRLVAAVGSDHPDLPVARVEAAFARLEAGREVVLGPAADGGYYLIAVTSAALRPALFERIDWSTPRVLAQTLERCRALGLEPSLLESWADVDRPEDLRRLEAALAGDGRECPETRGLLAAWGRI